MVAFVVEALDEVTVDGGSPLDGMDLMSPFVWAEDGGLRMMVRGVPSPLRASDPTGIIAAGASGDGLGFTLDPVPVIVPGACPGDADAGGCEDPTVTGDAAGGYVVYYTGVDAARAQGSLVAAAGPSLDRLEKRRVALQAPPGEGNIKEATLVRAAAGDWRLFYEYAANDASRIGVARADTLASGWEVLDDPFPVRGDSWDNWHLSTGPIVQPADGGDPVMFYNGATVDARWRIGWVTFSPDYARVTGRGIEPLLVPPPAVDRAATDIAFAASAVVEGDRIQLYYSIEDRLLRRATVRRYP